MRSHGEASSSAAAMTCKCIEKQRTQVIHLGDLLAQYTHTIDYIDYTDETRVAQDNEGSEDDLVKWQYQSVMLENSPPYMYANSSQALDAVIEIAEQAKVRNAAMLITGILVYNEATREVRAILEGPRDNVLKLLDCIRQDPRHHLDSAQDLSISDINTRSFGQWNMSLVKLHEGSTSKRRRGVQPCAANVEEQMIKGNLKVPFRDVKVFEEALSDPELSPGVF